MAGSTESESELHRDACSFVWDEATQLYFHASSGFYHDPDAGWYYCSHDGLYYKFENGNYVLLESEKADEPGADQSFETVRDEPTLGDTECASHQAPENPPPPSEWLEDTLIDLYLSGYNLASGAANDATVPMEAKKMDDFELSADDIRNDDIYELEEGEWIPEDHNGITNSNESVLDEGASWDEKNWLAQYGQVLESEKEAMPEFPVVDLWDWAMITGSKRHGKGQVARLIGRLVRRSAKLHPSMASGGSLKTAPISEVHLDLVRVTTGQVYKLRSPCMKYLASLSTYDSSNPTKDWGFPAISISEKGPQVPKSSWSSDSLSTYEVSDSSDMSTTLPDQLSVCERYKRQVYRDRAAERRNLHGGFGVGPGQKSMIGEFGKCSAPGSLCTEETAAEALNMSFGAGSYARRMLESMGWKEGESLGDTMKGLVKPIEPIGNIGNAGLGWPQGRRKQR